jgi:hypothetical protein
LQVSLKPLHDSIIGLISKLPTDGTVDQMQPVFNLPKGIKYSSYDLTAATDRLPVEAQAQILAKLLGDDMANL